MYCVNFFKAYTNYFVHIHHFMKVFYKVQYTVCVSPLITTMLETNINIRRQNLTHKQTKAEVRNLLIQPLLLQCVQYNSSFINFPEVNLLKRARSYFTQVPRLITEFNFKYKRTV